jgi:hypothetical protein
VHNEKSDTEKNGVKETPEALQEKLPEPAPVAVA